METKSIPQSNFSDTVKYYLKHGDMTAIAKEHGVSKSYVSSIMNPERKEFNQQILDSLIKLAERRKKEAKKHAARMKALAS